MRLLGLLVLVAWAGWAAAEVRPQESPLGSSLAWEGPELVRLGQGGRPAFLRGGPGRVGLRRLLAVREEPTGRPLIFRTSDGRRAEVAVSRAQEDTVRLTFRVAGKAR
ncbi:MAG: hypothetical protein ABDI20_07630 [Candidatus Bipolaricaulaceae bacterium]